MKPALFSLLLIALHRSVTVDCRPRIRDPEPRVQQHQRGSAGTGTNADTATGTRRFYLEVNESVRQGGAHTDFLVILPVRTATSNFVSIFDLRRKRFLCMDFTGKLYKSTQRDREDCLFQRIWVDVANHHDVFYSASGNRLLRLRGGELLEDHREPSETSSALLERLLSPLLKRQRRSEEVNPSDPLRSESHHSQSANDPKDADQPEKEKAGAVSKETFPSCDETITSCDDPLQVLQGKGPVSPIKTNIAEQAQQD